MKHITLAMVLYLLTAPAWAGDIPKNTGLYYLSLAEKYERQMVQVSITHLSPNPPTDMESIEKHRLFVAHTVYKGPRGVLMPGGTIPVAVPVTAAEEVVLKYGLVAGKKALMLEGCLTKTSKDQFYIRYRPPPPKGR